MASKTKNAAPSRVKQGTSKEAAAARKAVFVEAFIANGGNATQAAITAGYSEKTAGSQGQRLLKDVEISKALGERQQKLAEKHALTTESVIAELSKIVHADPRKLFRDDGSMIPVHEWPDGMAGAVASVEVDELFIGSGKDREQIGHTKKIKLWDKNSAIEKAMKHLGLFEKDNAQKASALDSLPPAMLQAMVGRLRELQNAGGH